MRISIAGANISGAWERNLSTWGQRTAGRVTTWYSSELASSILYCMESSLCDFCAGILRTLRRVRTLQSTIVVRKNSVYELNYAEKLCFRYALENLKFGKVDVGRYPDAAAKYNISDASTSKQLPTLIFFKDGKEMERRPYASNKGKLVKFLFSLVRVTLINIHFFT